MCHDIIKEGTSLVHPRRPLFFLSVQSSFKRIRWGSFIASAQSFQVLLMPITATFFLSRSKNRAIALGSTAFNRITLSGNDLKHVYTSV